MKPYQKPDKTENTRLIEEYLWKSDWKIKENANMSYSLQGLNNHIISQLSKDYWLNIVYPESIREAHQKGDIHIHDLQLLAPYCCGWDLYDLLIKGFTGVPHKLSCSPAKHLGSILGQLNNYFFTMQMEAVGAQAVSNFDTLLAPFIAYDNLSYSQVKQEIQSFVYNLNISTRIGFQTPFTNITLDLNPPAYYAQQPVVIGGKLQDRVYGEFQREMDMINQAFAEVMIEGDGKGALFTFPIPTYNITKNFDWSDQRLDPIWEMTAKYGIPYFANYINSDMNPEDARSMCCRLRLDNRELRKRGGGLFGANPLTGSIGNVTINLPRIGFTQNTEAGFFSILSQHMDTAKSSLMLKRKMLESLTERGLYPYSQVYLAGIKEKTGTYWGNHFNTIGVLGLNEAICNFMDTDLTTPEGQKFGLKVLGFMRDKLSEYQKTSNTPFNLEATPAEGTTYRLARLDKKYYPGIIVANEKRVRQHLAEPYYTNSSHLPVGSTEDIFSALDLQDALQTQYTGGTVFHGYLGERISEIDTTKRLVQKIAETYRLPYFTLTPTFSICEDHGYLVGEHPTCPHCQRACGVYSRVTGYIRPTDQWNPGKSEEFTDRKPYQPDTQRIPKSAPSV